MYSRVTFPPPNSRFQPVSPFYPYTTFRHCITVSVWRYKSHSSFVPSPMMSSDKWAEHERRAPVVGLNFTFLRTPPLILHSANRELCGDLSVHRDFTLWMFVSVHFTIYSSGSLEASRVQARKASSFASLFFGEARKKRFQLTSTKCSDLSQIPSIYLYVGLYGIIVQRSFVRGISASPLISCPLWALS